MTDAPPPCVLLAEEVWGSPLHAMRSLGARGVPVYVATAGRGSDVFGRSRWCRGAADFDPSDLHRLGREIAAWLDRAVEGDGPVPVIPLSDRLVEALHATRDCFGDRYRLALPSDELIGVLLDKGSSFAVAEKAGLTVPPWVVVSEPADVDAAMTMRLPVAVRPTRWSTTGGEYFKIAVEDDRTRLRHRLTDLVAEGAEVVVQEYVAAPDDAVEFSILWRSSDGRTTAICTGRKRRQTTAGGGVMVWGEVVERPDVREATERLLDELDFRGLGGVEFIRAGNDLWFIELNPRLEAIHFVAARAGLDTVLMAYEDLALGEQPDRVPRQGRATGWVGSAWLQQIQSNPRRWKIALTDRWDFARSPNRVRAVVSWRDPMPAAAVAARLARRARPGRSRHGRLGGTQP